MKYVVAFCAPFFSTLAASVGASRPASLNDWAIVLIVAAAAGFGGLGGIVTNDAQAKRKGK